MNIIESIVSIFVKIYIIDIRNIINYSSMIRCIFFHIWFGFQYFSYRPVLSLFSSHQNSFIGLTLSWIFGFEWDTNQPVPDFSKKLENHIFHDYGKCHRNLALCDFFQELNLLFMYAQYCEIFVYIYGVKNSSHYSFITIALNYINLIVWNNYFFFFSSLGKHFEMYLKCFIMFQYATR